MTSDQINTLFTIILPIVAAVGAYVVARLHFLQKMAEANTNLAVATTELETTKKNAEATAVTLDEAKQQADLKDRQLIQQQFDAQNQQIARLQAREAARDTTEQVLTDLVTQVREIKLAYVTEMKAFSTEMQSFKTQSEQSAQVVTEQLGLAVKEVNENTKTLFEQLIDEIRDMGKRLELSINSKADPSTIATTLREDVHRLESKIEALRTEQVETIRLAVADALGKAITFPTQTVTVQLPPAIKKEELPNEQAKPDPGSASLPPGNPIIPN